MLARLFVIVNENVSGRTIKSARSPPQRDEEARALSRIWRNLAQGLEQDSEGL